MRVDIFTSYLGGPYQWGRDLASALSSRCIESRHVHTFGRQALGMLHTRADICHTTVPFPVRLWRVPVVATLKADYTREHNLLQGFYPKLLADAQAVTVPSCYLQRSVPHATVIPNAVFPKQFRVIQHKSKQRLNLVTVMNFFFKGKADGLLRLVDIVKASGVRDFRWLVVGDGPFLERVKGCVRESGLDIRFSGYLADPVLVLQESDIFLYYSYHDNFPNVVLEAMACGLPVLTNKVGAIQEILDTPHNGFIGFDARQYREMFVSLATDTGLRGRLGQAARYTVEQKFNWDTIVDRYIDLYGRVLNGV